MNNFAIPNISAIFATANLVSAILSLPFATFKRLFSLVKGSRDTAVPKLTSLIVKLAGSIVGLAPSVTSISWTALEVSPSKSVIV